METDNMALAVGGQVLAKVRITEEVRGKQWVHAEPGDVGEVVDIEPLHNYPTVKFARTHSATICDPEELEELLLH